MDPLNQVTAFTFSFSYEKEVLDYLRRFYFDMTGTIPYIETSSMGGETTVHFYRPQTAKAMGLGLQSALRAMLLLKGIPFEEKPLQA